MAGVPIDVAVEYKLEEEEVEMGGVAETLLVVVDVDAVGLPNA